MLLMNPVTAHSLIRLERVASTMRLLLANTTSGNQDLFQWIEAHSTFVDIIKTIIVALLAVILWRKRYVRERRAAATLHLYACLRILLKDIKKKIETVNPYEAIYTESLRREIARDNGETATPKIDDFLNNFIEDSKRLRDIILDTDNNVYPRKKEREKWYEKQQELYDFTCFILEKEGVEKEKTNRKSADEKKAELEKTIDYYLDEIEKATISKNCVNKIKEWIKNRRHQT